MLKPRALMRMAALAAGLSCSSLAWAHGAFGESSSMWSGVFQLLTSPLALAALVGVAVAGAGVRDPWSPAAAGVAGVAAALAATWPALFATWMAPASVVPIGLAAVAALRPAPLIVMVLAVCGGLAAGRAADLDEVSTAGVAGVGASSAILVVLLLVFIDDLAKFQRLRAVVPIARRVLGSWVAAIALLLVALSLRAGV